ncbi:hypothetical protein ACWENO_00180 [Streptomyces sp. NPDC004436]
MRERQPYEVVLVRAGPEAAPAETTVMRLVGLLPAHWTCAQRLAADRITLLVRVHRPDGTGPGTGRAAGPGGNDAEDADAVRAWLARALGDASLCGWRATEPRRPGCALR